MIPLRDNIESRTRPVATYLLVAACSFAFVYQFLAEMSAAEAGRAIVLGYGMIPYEILRGHRLWTLLTSMFLHGGLFHIIGNMLFLWIFGDNVEDAFGRWKYLGLYFLSGIFGSVLHALLAPGSTIPTIGASGGVSGIMGAYFILYPRARVLTLVPIFFFLRFVYLPAFVLLGFWILFQLIYGFASNTGGGVAYFAHIGGFAVGVLLALLVRNHRQREPVWYDVS